MSLLSRLFTRSPSPAPSARKSQTPAPKKDTRLSSSKRKETPSPSRLSDTHNDATLRSASPASFAAKAIPLNHPTPTASQSLAPPPHVTRVQVQESRPPHVPLEINVQPVPIVSVDGGHLSASNPSIGGPSLHQRPNTPIDPEWNVLLFVDDVRLFI